MPSRLIFLSLALGITAGSFGEPIKLVERPPDPHGAPRPARNAADVPLRSSIYFELAVPRSVKSVEKTLAVSIAPESGQSIALLEPDERFAQGAAGWLRRSGNSLMVYVDPKQQLRPATRYTVRVTSDRSEISSWSFATEPAPSIHALTYRLDLSTPPLQWHGQFFCGICDVIFCTRAAQYGPTFDLMNEARKQHPRAWSLQRGFWLTGFEDRPPNGFFPSNLPNIVRERETRRISATDATSESVVLHVEDFFGHEQYGIPAGRPLTDDYHLGDEVLIADGIHDARAKVLAVNSAAGTVAVSPFPSPADGWKIAYEGNLPLHGDPDAPGLFPPGGCYLRKFNPPGTPCFFWGRLDKEWDLAPRAGRRLVANFADAPGDLSRDGRSWSTVKDYAQWHDAAGKIAGHIIDRYRKDALSFTWSIFNEPDLGGIFWRASWDELQTYYDYTTDAILRAFEDRGYDSGKVFIGGLEEGAVFGTNFFKLREFLAHCSPRTKMVGALPINAAMADHRLDGKRSRRVESLCRASGGKGAPCDFISIHSYNRSEMMAAKLIAAKQIALEIDEDYYKTIWIDSHESCPDWGPPPDDAAADAYLGDGYFPSWCADTVHRQLLRAAADPRFAYGQTILTVWPPPDNFAGLNALSRVIHYRDADGAEKTATLPMPIFHALTLLSDLGDRYWVLPEKTVGNHAIGGFASRDDQGVIHFLLFTHNPQDTQSRSDASFDISLEIASSPFHRAVDITEYSFDRDHNSPYDQIQRILGIPHAATLTLRPTLYSRADFDRVRAASECRATLTSQDLDPTGHLRLTVHLEVNGCDFLIITPKPSQRPR